MSEKTIKVTVDKSHLLTLGEQMYVESIELIRELVNNAYDADATEVYVTVTPESVVIEDDGSGMNEKGLAQFFTVGSAEKRVHSLSPRFGRKRVGQFGIGKFAALAAANRFAVESRKGEWVYSVIFDREEWQKSDMWELPITKEPATPLHHEGTRVTLTKLKRRFGIADVERYLKESVPLRVKKFSVFLNGRRITARFIPGRRFSLAIKTMYGPIEGEIVIAVKADLVEKPGIECRVKQVLIRREFFGCDRMPNVNLSRVTGEVNADFLPVVGSRDDFLRDSPEFTLFHQIMRTKLEAMMKELKDDSAVKRLKKIQEELTEALQRIRTALELHPELTPSGRTIALRRKRAGDLAGSTVVAPQSPPPTDENGTTALSEEEKVAGQKEKKEEKKEKIILPKPEVVKRIRLPQLGVSVAVAALGADGPEALAQGNLIYVNSDHPLYQKLAPRKEQFSLHLLRLITQEIVLMKKLRLAAKDAFEWQSKLLTDAIVTTHE